MPISFYHTDSIKSHFFCPLLVYYNCANFYYILLQVLLYAAVAMILIFPFDIFYLSSRFYFLRTLWRIVLPLQASLFLLRSILGPPPLVAFRLCGI